MFKNRYYTTCAKFFFKKTGTPMKSRRAEPHTLRAPSPPYLRAGLILNLSHPLSSSSSSISLSLDSLSPPPPLSLCLAGEDTRASRRWPSNGGGPLPFARSGERGGTGSLTGREAMVAERGGSEAQSPSGLPIRLRLVLSVLFLPLSAFSLSLCLPLPLGASQLSPSFSLSSAARRCCCPFR